MDSFRLDLASPAHCSYWEPLTRQYPYKDLAENRFVWKKNMFSSMNTNPKPFVSLSVALFWLDGHVANRPISWSREAPSTRLPVIKEHGTSIRGIRYTIYISYSYTSFWYVICLFWGLPRFHDQTQPSADRRAAKRATKGPHLPSRRELGGDSLPSNLGSPIPT